MALEDIWNYRKSKRHETTRKFLKVTRLAARYHGKSHCKRFIYGPLTTVMLAVFLVSTPGLAEDNGATAPRDIVLVSASLQVPGHHACNDRNSPGCKEEMLPIADVTGRLNPDVASPENRDGAIDAQISALGPIVVRVEAVETLLEPPLAYGRPRLRQSEIDNLSDAERAVYLESLNRSGLTSESVPTGAVDNLTTMMVDPYIDVLVTESFLTINTWDWSNEYGVAVHVETGSSGHPMDEQTETTLHELSDDELQDYGHHDVGHQFEFNDPEIYRTQLARKLRKGFVGPDPVSSTTTELALDSFTHFHEPEFDANQDLLAGLDLNSHGPVNNEESDVTGGIPSPGQYTALPGHMPDHELWTSVNRIHSMMGLAITSDPDEDAGLQPVVESVSAPASDTTIPLPLTITDHERHVLMAGGPVIPRPDKISTPRKSEGFISMRPETLLLSSRSPSVRRSRDSVILNATIHDAWNPHQPNLLAIFDRNKRRNAIVQMPDGRMLRVTRGSTFDGGTIRSISISKLTYSKNGKQYTLSMN